METEFGNRVRELQFAKTIRGHVLSYSLVNGLLKSAFSFCSGLFEFAQARFVGIGGTGADGAEIAQQKGGEAAGGWVEHGLVGR